MKTMVTFFRKPNTKETFLFFFNNKEASALPEAHNFFLDEEVKEFVAMIGFVLSDKLGAVLIEKNERFIECVIPGWSPKNVLSELKEWVGAEEILS